jgi:hypothetical protein
MITGVELERLDGDRRPFGQWLIADITNATTAQFQRCFAPRTPHAHSLYSLAMRHWARCKRYYLFEIRTRPVAAHTPAAGQGLPTPAGEG